MNKSINPSPPLYRVVLTLAIPAIARLWLQTLIFLADRIMLGRYSTEALASLRISEPLIWSVTGVLSAFSIGSVAVVGRAVGAGDRALATTTARVSLAFAAGVGLIFTTLSLLGLDGLLFLFPNISTEIWEAARSYMQLVFLVTPLFLMAEVAAAMLQASGNTRTPFLVAIAANGVNLVGNYLLIFGKLGFPELGVRGAALDSAIAIGLNAVVLLGVLGRSRSGLSLQHLEPLSSPPALKTLSRILRIALPALGERVMRGIGYTGFTLMIGMLGGVAMATHAALLGIEEHCYEAADGFGIAVAAVISQRLGAGKPEEAERGAWVTMGMAIALLSVSGVMFVLIPAQLLGAFTADTRIIGMGIPCLYVAAIAQPFMATSIVLEQALRGAGNTRTAFYISLFGWLVVRLAATAFFVFGLHWGLVGVWVGSTCDWIARTVGLMLVFRQKQWHRVTV